jgi:hypothetical protein
VAFATPLLIPATILGRPPFKPYFPFVTQMTQMTVFLTAGDILSAMQNIVITVIIVIVV